MSLIMLIVGIVVFVWQCVNTGAMLRTANNTAAILKLLQQETASHHYKEWKDKNSN
jgi:hypothetical protein